MRASSQGSTKAVGAQASRYSRRPGSASRPSADLAGRRVALSLDVPVAFDAPLAAHHKLIGAWAATREPEAARYTRFEARRHIEATFGAAVLEILTPIGLADLRVVALCGDENMPPAIAIICDTVGQLDLGWIEESNVLSTTLFKRVAPPSWCAAAYKALCETLKQVLPIFGYEDLFEEMSAYYWDGETDDVAATKVMIEYHGADEAEIDEEMLPSAMNARRPAWMLAENAAPMRQLPAALRQRIGKVRQFHNEVKGIPPDGSAWHFEFDRIVEYMPGFEDCSHLPAMTLVPADQFARELDYVGDHGMQQGFMNIAGLCPLADADAVDRWLASLKLGADFLLAAQDLINFDPGEV